jgi:phosphatidylglycerol:prolipoprotein diacylglycerol transferase
MYPYFWPDLFGYNLPMYDLMITIGILFLMIFVARQFDLRDGYERKYSNRILVFLAISLGVALGTSYLFDGLFHTLAEGEPTFGSITFIGGLIGGLASFVLLLKYAIKVNGKQLLKILNTVIVGVVLAHAFGRIGCYLAGCCYGIPSESLFGVDFHSGESIGEVLPTNLYEALFLFGLFGAFNLIRSLRNREFSVYLMAYGTFRFLIEFIRGDDRGSLFGFIHTTYNTYPTPSQYLSLLMIGIGVYIYLKHQKNAVEIPSSEVKK